MVRSVRARSARISIISHFHISIDNCHSHRSLIRQEHHSKSNFRIQTQLERKLTSHFAIEHRYAREASADTIRITTSEDVVKEEKTEEKGLKCAMTLEEAVRIWTIYPVNKRGKDSASVFKTTLRRCSVCCAVSVSRVCVDDGIEFLCGRTDEEKFVDKDGKSVSESLLSPFVHAYGCKRQSERPDECVPCSLTFLEVEKLRRTWSLLFQ